MNGVEHIYAESCQDKKRKKKENFSNQTLKTTFLNEEKITQKYEKQFEGCVQRDGQAGWQITKAGNWSIAKKKASMPIQRSVT